MLNDIMVKGQVKLNILLLYICISKKCIRAQYEYVLLLLLCCVFRVKEEKI